VKTSLVFLDWLDRDLKSVYNTEKGVELSKTDFHSGSTFSCNIELDAEQEEFLLESIMAGYRPVFCVMRKS